MSKSGTYVGLALAIGGMLLVFLPIALLYVSSQGLPWIDYSSVSSYWGYILIGFLLAGSGVVVVIMSEGPSTLSMEPTGQEEVGGLDEVKATLREMIELPLLRPELFEKYRVTPPAKGVLLYGPPGCGKTLLAKSIAAGGTIRFLYNRSTDIFTKYYSESATRVRQLFEDARSQAPCVLFLDEIDALVPVRGFSDEVGSREDVRVTSEFLAQMDGLSPLEKVVVFGATNRPEAIDSALLRPGRFDKILYVPPPDSAARLAILKRNMHGIPTADVDFDAVSDQTEGYSGADLAALCREAKMLALKDEVKGLTRPISNEDFSISLRHVKPSITISMLKKYEDFDNSFRQSRQ